MNTIALRLTGCWMAFASFATNSPLPAEETRSAGIFTAEERRLCDQLALKNQPWAGIRWEVSLTEARARAEREGKPVFLVVNTGNVLGFV